MPHFRPKPRAGPGFLSLADADSRRKELWFKINRLLAGSWFFPKKFGAVAQLVAHLHGMQGVRGSSPLSSTEKPLE
jgi:hypothetical protein